MIPSQSEMTFNLKSTKCFLLFEGEFSVSESELQSSSNSHPSLLEKQPIPGTRSGLAKLVSSN